MSKLDGLFAQRETIEAEKSTAAMFKSAYRKSEEIVANKKYKKPRQISERKEKRCFEGEKGKKKRQSG